MKRMKQTLKQLAEEIYAISPGKIWKKRQQKFVTMTLKDANIGIFDLTMKIARLVRHKQLEAIREYKVAYFCECDKCS